MQSQFLPAQCSNIECGHIFPSPIPATSGAFFGNTTTCGKCGSTAKIINAFGSRTRHGVSIHASDPKSASILSQYRALKKIAQEAVANEQDIAVEEIIAMVAGVSPEWADRLSGDANRGKRYIIFAISIIARLLVVGLATGAAFDQLFGDRMESFVQSQSEDYNSEERVDEFMDDAAPDLNRQYKIAKVNSNLNKKEQGRGKNKTAERAKQFELKKWAKLRRTYKQAYIRSLSKDG